MRGAGSSPASARGAHTCDVDQRRPARGVVHEDPVGMKATSADAGPGAQPAAECRERGVALVGRSAAGDVVGEEPEDVRQADHVVSQQHGEVEERVFAPAVEEGRHRDARAAHPTRMDGYNRRSQVVLIVAIACLVAL